MNTVITSKESILKVSRELIANQGWAAINIRTVAAANGVSVGSIYNYFDSKSDLVSATVESVWHDIFHFSQNEGAYNGFISCVEWIFGRMEQGNKKYPGFFTLHSISFLEEEKPNGKQRMEQSWRHIKQELHAALMDDKNVRPQAFDKDFTPEKFIDIIFSLIISALVQQSYDCSGILEMARRIIY